MNLINITDTNIETDKRNILITSILSAKIFEDSCNLKLENEKDEIFCFFKNEKEKDNIEQILEIHFKKKALLRKMTLWEHITNDFFIILILALNFCLVLSYIAQSGRVRVPTVLYPIVVLGTFLPEYILQILITFCFIILIYRLLKSFMKKKEVLIF